MRIQWIIGSVLIERVEDVVVALVLSSKPGSANAGAGEQKATEEPNSSTWQAS